MPADPYKADLKGAKMTHARSLYTTLRAATLVALAALPVTAQRLPVKQLAGPADDFGLMRLPTPQDLAQESKRSVTAVDLSSNGEWRHEIVTDAGAEFHLILLRAEESDWQVDLQRPDGVWINSVQNSPDTTWTQVPADQPGLGLPATSGLLAQTYTGVGDGRWVISVKSPQVLAKAAASRLAKGMLIVVNQGPWSLRLWPRTLASVVAQPVRMRAEIVHDRGVMSTFTVEDAHVQVTRPDGTSLDWQVAATGHLFKSSAVSALDFDVLPTSSGLHLVGLRFVGRDSFGSLIQRSVEMPIYVVDPPLDLAIGTKAGSTARAAVLQLEGPKSTSEKPRLRVDVPTRYTKGLSAGGDVRAKVYAELWGRDHRLLPLPVAWIGGMKYVEDRDEGPVLPLQLDARWIARAGAQPPYELRHLRLQDPDTSIPYATVERLAVTSQAPTALLKSDRGTDIEIDDDMGYGPRPAWLDEAAAQKSRPQETILLVHGYCSGAVWQPYESHFNPEPVVRFIDHGQARSNDAFAQRIRSRMIGVNHFSTISHSQGGMAALHLFTHYWSGLDNSDAARPMQSVGTPYNGSSLMNDQIFFSLLGLGQCDPVLDLTTLGAAFWRVGIPASARNKVYFYRTRGQDLIPCFWSSPIIGGRDDGIVSTREGDLSGGHDMGITRKQCHSSGMVHKIQLSDHGRNASMASRARIWLPDPLEACARLTQSSFSAPSTVSLDASCSTVESGWITSYSWNITGPESYHVSGQQTSVVLNEIGLYRVQLTVTSTNPSLTDTVFKTIYLSICDTGELECIDGD